MVLIKSNLRYTRGTTPKRVTSSGANFCGLAPGRFTFVETSQLWRFDGDTVSNVNSSVVHPRPATKITISSGPSRENPGPGVEI